MLLAAYLNWKNQLNDKTDDIISNMFGCAIAIINFTLVPLLMLYIVSLPR